MGGLVTFIAFVVFGRCRHSSCVVRTASCYSVMHTVPRRSQRHALSPHLRRIERMRGSRFWKPHHRTTCGGMPAYEILYQSRLLTGLVPLLAYAALHGSGLDMNSLFAIACVLSSMTLFALGA